MPNVDAADAPRSMKNKDYRHLIRPLRGELVQLQEWVKSTGSRVCIVFECRDTAVTGGVIAAMTVRVSPRVFRVVALTAPTGREKLLVYIQRYLSPVLTVAAAFNPRDVR
ncbi:hypothetical protein BH683_002520 [Williamsia sp. 1138]|nr:hypothetical protein BH683_002520 [Williamsia sp. 1138]